MLVIVIGFALMGITVAIHALGAAVWLSFMAKSLHKKNQNSQLRQIFQSVVWTAMALLFLHMVEVIFWAAAYYALPGHAGLSSFSESIYFSIVTFTTLGYGDITLSTQWDALAGMEAMVGIVVFGLTTALIFAIVQRIWMAADHRNDLYSGPNEGK